MVFTNCFTPYTLSHLENNRRCMVQNDMLVIAHVTSVFFYTFKKEFSGLLHKLCVLQHVSFDTMMSDGRTRDKTNYSSGSFISVSNIVKLSRYNLMNYH